MTLSVQFQATGVQEPPCDLEPYSDVEASSDVTHSKIGGDKQEVCFKGTVLAQTKTLIFAPILLFIALTVLP